MDKKLFGVSLVVFSLSLGIFAYTITRDSSVDGVNTGFSLDTPYANIEFSNQDHDAWLETIELTAFSGHPNYPEYILWIEDTNDDGIPEEETVMAKLVSDGPKSMDNSYFVEVPDRSRLIFGSVNSTNRNAVHAEDKNLDGTIDFLMQNQTAIIFYQDSWHEVLNREGREQESFKINGPDGEIELLFGENGWEEK